MQLLTILRVNLTTFNATPKNTEVELNWAVATGSTTKHFEAERSSYGINFTKIIAGSSLQLQLSSGNKLPADFYIIKVSGINEESITGKIIVQ